MTISVLHIFPKNDSMISNYVTMLTQAMGNRVISAATDDVQEAKHIINDLHPDILHQHGQVAWARQSEFRHFRKVLTPHGQSIDGQEPYVIVARSSMEAKLLNDFPRIETVRNPLVTKSVKPDETAEKTIRIYQKVLDSDVLPLMNEDSRDTLRMLLKVALCGDRQWIGDRPLPSSPQWRLLYIYTWHEGVSPLLDRGLTLMGLQIPPHTTPISYLPEDYQRPVSRTKASIPELMTEIERQLRQGRLELLLLCDLHQALYRPTLNEEKLCKELKERKLIELFSSSLQILKEQLLLDEGFMPCAPADNHTTSLLRSSLTKHLKI